MSGSSPSSRAVRSARRAPAASPFCQAPDQAKAFWSASRNVTWSTMASVTRRSSASRSRTSRARFSRPGLPPWRWASRLAAAPCSVRPRRRASASMKEGTSRASRAPTFRIRPALAQSVQGLAPRALPGAASRVVQATSSSFTPAGGLSSRAFTAGGSSLARRNRLSAAGATTVRSSAPRGEASCSAAMISGQGQPSAQTVSEKSAHSGSTCLRFHCATASRRASPSSPWISANRCSSQAAGAAISRCLPAAA